MVRSFDRQGNLRMQKLAVDLGRIQCQNDGAGWIRSRQCEREQQSEEQDEFSRIPERNHHRS
jgi:hypothetical protein